MPNWRSRLQPIQEVLGNGAGQTTGSHHSPEKDPAGGTESGTVGEVPEGDGNDEAEDSRELTERLLEFREESHANDVDVNVANEVVMVHWDESARLASVRINICFYPTPYELSEPITKFWHDIIIFISRTVILVARLQARDRSQNGLDQAAEVESLSRSCVDWSAEVIVFVITPDVYLGAGTYNNPLRRQSLINFFRDRDWPCSITFHEYAYEPFIGTGILNSSRVLIRDYREALDNLRGSPWQGIENDRGNNYPLVLVATNMETGSRMMPLGFGHTSRGRQLRRGGRRRR